MTAISGRSSSANATPPRVQIRAGPLRLTFSVAEALALSDQLVDAAERIDNRTTTTHIPKEDTMTDNDRPVFDNDRPDPDRRIRFSTEVTMRVDATGESITMPLRGVFTTDSWAFELGPFSLRGEDACDLTAALAHYADMSGDFARHEVDL